jgi:uncharacterized protein YtpQ (UPF0354 family)
MPALTVKVTGEKELRITNPKGKESTAFLDNAYAEYRQHPKDLSAVIQKFSGGLVESSREDDSMDRSRIVPIVKDRNWIKEIQESTKSRGADDAPENVFDDFNEELVVVYAEDNPKTIRYLTPENLAKLGIARGELRALAVENLKRLIPQIEVLPGPLVSMVKADGDYEASLLLFNELWSNGQIRVDGDFVVAIPARDLLLVTGSRNLAGIAKLRELASRAVRASSYHLTEQLFVYRNGSFTRLPLQ